MGRSGPGACWGPISRPGPSPSGGPGLLGCCHLTDDLLGSVGNSQSPEQGGGCRFQPKLEKACLARSTTDWSSAGYAAVVWVIGENDTWPRGSYTSPLIQSRCSKTASFRATATVARFLAFFPPRSHSFFPNRRKSVSGPNGPRMSWALPTN